MNPKFKNLLFLFALTLSLGVVFTSCKKDEGNDPFVFESGIKAAGAEELHTEALITTNVALTNDKVWELKGRVVVTDGATLTIQEGTIIKSHTGTEENASALLIARGGKLIANGTATNPIVMTSINDNIALGETAGTNLTVADQGLWGGLIILGNAPGSFKNNVEAEQIEGIPADDSNGLYGGNDETDSSGSIQYVSIRHGGTLLGADNEINGLTLGGVGSGTVINNVEVIANKDDGVEFFGGTVNASGLMVYACGDDGLDIDQSYKGTITNSVVVLGDNSDHAMEIDGPEGTATGSFTLNNITLKGNENTEKGEYADYRSKAMGASNNVYAYGFKASSDVELDNNGVSQNFLDGELSFSNWEIAGFDNSIFVEKVGCAENCDDTDDNNDVDELHIILDPSFTDRAAAWTTQVAMGAQSVGATASDFDWTYTHAQGAF